MILGFDIGNTNTIMGIYLPGDGAPSREYRYTTMKNSAVDETAALILSFLRAHDIIEHQNAAIEGIVVSSVVPEINSMYRQIAEKYFTISPIILSHQSRTSISIQYDDITQLGIDRIVNCEAAHAHYGIDAVIIDMGTAMTVSVLSAAGVFEGGLIAPGLQTSINALSERASQLFTVPIEKPASILAKNTHDALISGSFYGWTCMIDGFLAKINEETRRTNTIILTGGLSSVIGPHLEGNIIIDGQLTMKGLRLLYELNKT